MDERGGNQENDRRNISTNYVDSKIVITAAIALLFGLVFVVGLIALGFHFANDGEQGRSSDNPSGRDEPVASEFIEVKYEKVTQSYLPAERTGDVSYKSSLLHEIGVDDSEYAVIRNSSELEDLVAAVNVLNKYSDKPFTYYIDSDFFKTGSVVVVAKEEKAMSEMCVDGIVRDENYNLTIDASYATDSDTADYGGEFALLKIENIQPKTVKIEWGDSSPGFIYDEKPIIYIYPTETMSVNVRLSNPERILVDYPDYRDGWNVTAHPDGTLEAQSGKKLYALYYESQSVKQYSADGLREGFVVARYDVESFLEQKLELLGLNYKEREEFITYWANVLEEKPYAFIRFQTRAEIDQTMGLIVSPKPDTMIRVIMEYKPLNRKITTTEQRLEPVMRQGFTVVEWGGIKIK